MSMSPFQVMHEPLERGINLIEASAGTGKTYTIAMLILRFIIERGFTIEQLLVVTFTKAATEELRLRIRGRLNEALNIVSQGGAGADPDCDHDPQLVAWLMALELPTEEVSKRLRLALLDIDRAAIFTIHGMCQRLLGEFPLDGGQQFELELMADTSAMMQSLMDDFWRREIYRRPGTEVAPLLWRYASPDKLYDSVRGIDWRRQIFPAASGLDSALADLAVTYKQVQREWPVASDGLYATLNEMLTAERFMKPYRESFSVAWQQLDRFCRGDSTVVPDPAVLQMLSLGWLQSTNGLKKRHWCEAEQLVFVPLEAYYATLERVQIELRLQLLNWLASEYDKRMEGASQLSFDALIVRLGELLGGEHSIHLKQAIQQKYLVALIDEFQDTDQTQWSIFSQLFGGQEGQHFLYLIGDPKQAIYKFRGADIFSYFAAQAEASRSYTLEQNWRSTPPLVESVNHLFEANDAPFLFDRLKFHAVRPARDIADGHIQVNGGVAPPLVLWQLPESGQSNGFWSPRDSKAEAAIREHLVAEVTALLAASAEVTIVDKNGGRKPVPGDIAILVRSHRQAFDLQRLLADAGVPSVHSGSSNIFSSDEAKGLLPLLAAVANPGDLHQLKNLLTLPWCGLDGESVHAILTDDNRLSEWFDHLHRYHLLWLKNGVMSMLDTLVDERLIEAIAQLQNPERILTNINHLAELLQREVEEQSLGIHKTVAWLQREVAQRSAGSEDAMNEQQLRLESDAEALKIITLHSAKGLEFPIVFLPYLWQRPTFVEREQNRISCHEAGELVTDIGSDEFERRKARAIEEELAEELRLLYVALTRAKYRCYLAWADARTKEIPNRSALAYLLFSCGGPEWQASLEGLDYGAQQQRLRSMATGNPAQFEYRELAVPAGSWVQMESPPQRHEMTARTFGRHLERRWQMSSYSALANLSSSHGLHYFSELPADKAQEGLGNLVIEGVADEPGEMPLPRGAHFGNVLHELLERIPFGEIASGAIDSELSGCLMQRYGLELETPEQHVQFNRLLQRVVTTPLTGEEGAFTLATIAPERTLKEMPFYIPMAQVNTRAINRLLQGDPAVSPLHEIELEGYLTGFIDLIFEHQGRYYVLDYKSNFLESYQPAALEKAMQHHNYGLQYWLYSVVLHRYLKRRLTDYNYADHFGGALYLFARGMDPAQPGSGIYRATPDEGLLLALDRLLGGES